MATNVVATGRIELVDLNDNKQLQLFISSSQPKSQIFNIQTGAYTPNWLTSKPVLTPQLFIAGSSTDIINNAKSITWYEDSDTTPISGGDYTLSAGNKTLTINRNIMGSANLVPPFDSGQWFPDSSAGSGTVVVDSANPYKVTLTVTPSQGLLVHIPVQEGKTYALDFASITTGGLIRIYKGKVTAHTTSVTEEEPSSFTVDSSYNGWCTLRITSGISGTYVFQNPQLEVGSTPTAFAPMDYTNRKLIFCEVVYTDTDTGFDVKTKASIEFNKIPTGDKGYKGETGDNAIVANLSNDFHAVLTNSTGGSGIYTDAISTMTIYNGSTDDSANWTVSATPSSGVTGSLSGRTYTVTNMTTDTGYVDITASRSGYTSVTKRFNLIKSKQGSTGNTGNTGSSATAYWMVLDAMVIRKDGSIYSPSSINATAKSKVGTGTPANYSGRFIIAESTDGTTFTDKYTSSANEATKNYVPTTGVKSVRVRLYLAGGTTTLIDEQTIPVVEDGGLGVGGYNSINTIVWTPSGNTIKNSEGEIVAKADLYDGNTSIQGSNYKWYKETPNKTSIAGSGWEDLSLGRNNLLKNSDFSSGTANWNGISSNIVDGYDGSLGAYIARSGYADTNRTFINYGTSVGITADKTYTYSGWFYIDSSIPFDSEASSFFIRKYKTANGADGFNDIINVPIKLVDYAYDTWHYFSGTGTVPSGSIGSEQVSFGLGKNGKVIVSQLKVEEGSYASPWVLNLNEMPIEKNLYGNNLVANTSCENGTTNWSTAGTDVSSRTIVDEPLSPSGKAVKIAFTTSTTTSGGTHNPSAGMLEVGKKYTISAYIRADVAGGVNFGHEQGGTSVVTVGTTYQKFTKTFTAIDSQYRSSIIYRTSGATMNELYVHSLKLEEGAISTDWSPKADDTSSFHPKPTKGLNSWVFRYYDYTTTSLSADYTVLDSMTDSIQTIIPDASDLLMSYSDTYFGYLKTAVYVSQDKDISFFFRHDDGCSVYINGLQVYYNALYISAGTTKTFSLKKGWNTMEFIFKEGTGGDGVFDIAPLIGSQVEEMNCYYAYDYGKLEGRYGVIGYNTPEMIVSNTAIVNVETFRCLVEYESRINFFDRTTANTGQYIGFANGTMSASGQGHSASDYIEVEPSTSYIGKGIRTAPSSGGVGMAYYDEDKVFISGLDYASGDYLKTFTTPSNAKYLRFSFLDSEIDNVVLEGDSFKPYEDYCVVYDVTDPFNITILGLSTFKNGQGTSSFTAKLFQNGLEIDADDTKGYEYKWYIYNEDDTKNNTWNGTGYKTGKTITVSANDISNQGRLVCEVDA